jgi:hypothetical protein
MKVRGADKRFDMDALFMIGINKFFTEETGTV